MTKIYIYIFFFERKKFHLPLTDFFNFTIDTCHTYDKDLALALGECIKGILIFAYSNNVKNHLFRVQKTRSSKCYWNIEI